MSDAGREYLSFLSHSSHSSPFSFLDELFADNQFLCVAYISNGNHTLQRVHLPRIYHTQHQTSGTRSGSIGKVCICAVHERAGRYGGSVFGDGTGVESPWGFQIGSWDSHGGRWYERRCRRV